MVARSAAMRLLLVAALAGCGRIGFGALGHEGDGGAEGDAGKIPDGGTACVQGNPIVISQTAVESADPSIAWNGMQLGVAWIEDPNGARTGMFRTTTLAGSLQASQTLIAMPAGEDDMGIVADGAAFKLSIGASTGGKRQVFRSTNGAAPVAITSTAKDNFRPRIARIGQGITAYVFEELTGGTSYEARLSVVNEVDTKIVAEVQVLTGISGPYSLDADFDGTNLAVFAAVPGAIVMQRFTTQGAVVGSTQMIGTTSQSVADVGVAWAGDRHLLMWIDGGAVNIVYLDTQGAKLHPLVQTGSSPLSFYGQAYAGDGADLIVWTDAATGTSYLVPMARDGSAGAQQTLADTGQTAAAWTGSAWAIASTTTSTPREVQVSLLCP